MRHNISEINEIIKDRRTIYPEQFSKRKVHKEIIEEFLDNARWAPTHGMTQPWRFKVFMGEGLVKLSEFQSSLYMELTSNDSYKESKFNKLKERPLKSSAVVAICMKRQESEKITEIDEICAVASAVQNIQLSASAYGIGCYWGTGGVTFKEETKNFLDLNTKDKCLGFLYIGYPDIEWPKGQRRPIEYYTEWITEY